MSVASLREAIRARTRELFIPALVEAGLVAHKRHWKNCTCSWCSTKQEATLVIGSHCPRFTGGSYVSAEAQRDAWREEQRHRFRGQLTRLEVE